MTVYGQYALNYPNRLKFVAVAEPIKSRREHFARLHNIPLKSCFDSWTDLLEKEQLANIAFICTQDQMHIEPTIRALKKGYDVLLEKPMANTLEGCIKIVKCAENTGRILGIGHVLRYTDFFSKITELIRNKVLGEIVNISHSENVSWYHMAHSFVRGNWRNQAQSSPMILAKCCHDLDLLYWMIGALPKKISSFGSLLHFTHNNAPKSAPNYCIEGCPIENSCLYYAPRIYIDIAPILQIMKYSNNRGLRFLANLRKEHKIWLKYLSKVIKPLNSLTYWREWPVEPLYFGQDAYEREDFSDGAKMEILRSSPYGRCVYKCDNDVVDHQVVNIEFMNGATATLIMHGFSEREGRTLRIDGTRGTLFGEFRDCGQKITINDHYNGEEKIIFTKDLTLNTKAHGGGDDLLISAFLDNVLDKDKSQPLTNARAILESHLMAFAAHSSRLSGQVIQMKLFREKAEKL
ncbi:MAG: gfo/Idh/MocA family oxidoreductase [Candidatus Lokiarchaeota archaeon]|nr:gfo/Idh/MocA family oxidoreductase [Candidatus Lokiarchaeota archaeon]